MSDFRPWLQKEIKLFQQRMRNEGVVNISYSKSRSAESASGTVLTCHCLKHVIALAVLQDKRAKAKELA